MKLIGKYHILTSLIIALIAAMTILVIYDRYHFHRQVITIANSYIDCIREQQNDNTSNSSFQQREEMEEEAFTNHIVNHPVHTTCCNNAPLYSTDTHSDISLLEVMEKSDGLLGANGLTFLVTLIVALLASLLVYRMDKMDRIVAKYNRFEEETKYYYGRISKYDLILTRVESLYNLSMIIGNIVTALSPDKSNNRNEQILSQIGMLLYRLSKICRQIDYHLNDRNPKNRLDYMTQEENNILDTYIEDALNELKSNHHLAESMECQKLGDMITKQINSIQNIKDTLDDIEVQQKYECATFVSS